MAETIYGLRSRDISVLGQSPWHLQSSSIASSTSGALVAQPFVVPVTMSDRMAGMLVLVAANPAELQGALEPVWKDKLSRPIQRSTLTIGSCVVTS